MTSFSKPAVRRSQREFRLKALFGWELTNWPHLGHNGCMSAVPKGRIDPELKHQAEAVLEEIGLKPRAALELFYKQIVKRRAIPFPVQADCQKTRF